MKVAPVILFFSFPLVLAGQAQVDFSGIDQFWEIVDLLEQDIEPDERKAICKVVNAEDLNFLKVVISVKSVKI